ncbi:unnamed protein product [Cylindrotheca closterium]|uniref:Aminotransferase class I/classII large domain-containing protein n=1 Tax=Cylindrotheca closterium TaxID=2856 RepID=A0AAD2FI14_9STRA|nr:unnamed protein product [Cylindrotheca closterium]
MLSTNNDSVGESTIRLMTRLANEYKALNLSQGVPSESPPWDMRLKLAWGVLNGMPLESASLEKKLLQNELVELIQNGPSGKLDQINQYSPPMGRADLRSAISEYYKRFYQYDVSPDEITVTLGATEAFASALRTLGRPGDNCVIIEPFHELYPNQCKIFYLQPVFVSLKATGSEWILDANELEEALKDAKMLLLNSPHNPTGKVFSRDELKAIVDLCLKHDVYIVTDEIYEHMCFDGTSHYVIPKEFPEIADRTLVCNSLGKSASATGWRLGWCLHPPHVSDTYRGIHDQMTVMSPHPVQYAAMHYFTLPDEFFQGLCRKYKERVRKLEGVLASVGFGIVSPQGAYYLFVDYTEVEKLNGKSCLEAAMYLLKEVGVACVPGDNFYGTIASKQAARHLRFAACRSPEDLDEATRRIQQHLGR